MNHDRRIERVHVGTPHERTFYVLVVFDGEARPETLLGAVTYEASPLDGYASINQHWTTNLTGAMSRNEGIPCEFLCNGEACWFDGTSLAPARSSEDEIWAALERWAPTKGSER